MAIAAHIQSIGNGKSAWIGSSGNITVLNLVLTLC